MFKMCAVSDQYFDASDAKIQHFHTFYHFKHIEL